MNERVAAVVAGFRRLSNQEKIEAFLEIEEVWKALQARAVPPRRDPRAP